MGGLDRLMMAGAALFAAGASVVVLGIGRGSDALAVLGAAVIAGAAVCLGVAAWRSYTRVDWSRVEAEQRLWESGPLGRAWLRIRTTLFGR